MKQVLFFLIMLSWHIGLFSQSAITITSQNGTTKVATNLISAIELAQTDDILYLPAGNFDLKNVVVNKKLHIIGAGYNPKINGTNSVTYCTGTLTITDAGSGGSVQGIYVSGAIQFGTSLATSSVKNYVIQRCFFNVLLLGYTWDGFNEAENIVIRENMVEGAIFGGKAKNVIVSNNYLRQTGVTARLVTHFANAKFYNNIFVTIDNYPFNGIWGCIFENNIVTFGNFGYVNAFENNQYLNNLYCHEPGLNAIGVVRSEGNVYMPLEDIFVNYTGGPLSFDDNYHLTPEALSAITGTDGTQVGIYGTTNPFKELGIPVNPIIQTSKVSSMTNPKGQLKIEFKVEAQNK